MRLLTQVWSRNPRVITVLTSWPCGRIWCRTCTGLVVRMLLVFIICWTTTMTLTRTTVKYEWCPQQSLQLRPARLRLPWRQLSIPVYWWSTRHELLVEPSMTNRKHQVKWPTVPEVWRLAVRPKGARRTITALIRQRWAWRSPSVVPYWSWTSWFLLESTTNATNSGWNWNVGWRMEWWCQPVSVAKWRITPWPSHPGYFSQFFWQDRL